MARDIPHQAADHDGDESASTQSALVDELGQCAFVVMGALTRIAADHDLSLTQLRVLGILRGRRLRMAQLAAFLGLDKSTMSGLIERAERRGLVTRARNAEDRRAVDVFMTGEGYQLAETVQDDVQRGLTPMTDRLNPTQQRSLAEGLRAALSATILAAKIPGAEPVRPRSSGAVSPDAAGSTPR